MELTESQVRRQMLRIRDGIFDTFKEVDAADDAYTGELKEDIKNIIQSSIITNKILNEEEFALLFSTTADKMVEWILSNIDGVDRPVAHIFCVDLLEQTLSRVYSVEEVDDPHDNYMHG